MLRHYFTSSCFVVLVACAPDASQEHGGSTKDEPAPGLELAAVQYKDNKALLFAGSGEHKEFMAEVVPVVASWFDEQDVGFKSTHYADLTAAEIKQRIKETAAAMSGEGSLALYFLTHGSPDGYMLAKDRLFRMSEVVAVLQEARPSTPLRRLMVFVETCYSGNQVNAFGLTETAVSDGPLPVEMAGDDPYIEGMTFSGFGLTASPAFTEAVIVTSSKNNQLSNVPVFSNALYKAFIDFNYEDNATIRQWLGKVREHTLADAPAPQEPMYKGIPDSVLDQKLWMDERAPAPGSTEIPQTLTDQPITPDDIPDDAATGDGSDETGGGEDGSGEGDEPSVADKAESSSDSDDEDSEDDADDADDDEDEDSEDDSEDEDDDKSSSKPKKKKSSSGSGKSGGAKKGGCGVTGVSMGSGPQVLTLALLLLPALLLGLGALRGPTAARVRSRSRNQL